MRKIKVEKHDKSFKKRTIFIGLFLTILALGVLLYFNFGPTGKVTFSIETNYDPNSTLKGNMVLSLKPGELIPKDSVLTFSMENNTYEFVLSELVSDETVNGDFYGEGLTLSGNGEGYGIPGIKETFSDVDFVMKVTKGNSNAGDSRGNSEETVTEETVTEEIIAEEETTEEETVTEETTTEETVTEEVIAEEETTEEETSPGNSGNSNAGGNSNNGNGNSNAGGNSNNGNGNSNAGGNSPLTGNVIATIEEEVSGTVSGNNKFTYELGPGETASIVSSTGEVSLSIEGNIVTVTTSYSEKEEGFGADYLGDDYEYQIRVDLTSLELDVEEGDLVVSLHYSDTEIASISTTLSIDDPNKTTSLVPVLPLEKESISDFALNTDQLFALKSKTGVDIAEITKAEEINGRLIIRFQAGTYWLENSYDLNIDEGDLKYQIELDRAKFTQRLAKSLLQTEESAVKVEGYLGTESLVSKEVSNEIVGETTEELVEEETNESVVEEEQVNNSLEVNSS